MRGIDEHGVPLRVDDPDSIDEHGVPLRVDDRCSLSRIKPGIGARCSPAYCDGDGSIRTRSSGGTEMCTRS